MKKDHISAADYKLLKTEHQIQTEIINWLTSEGFYVQRMNSGVIAQTNKDGTQRRIFMGKSGTPDIMAFQTIIHTTPDGYKVASIYLLFVEVKRPGKTITENQRVTIQELERYGATCIIAHSVEELQKTFDPERFNRH